MTPHERSLVKKMEGKPFALLGINSDPDRYEIRRTCKKEEITWRSWFDGGGTHGPIATQWDIHGWPTIYVVDAKGVVRNKFVGDPGSALDHAVERLVMEVKTGIKIIVP